MFVTNSKHKDDLLLCARRIPQTKLNEMKTKSIADNVMPYKSAYKCMRRPYPSNTTPHPLINAEDTKEKQ